MSKKLTLKHIRQRLAEIDEYEGIQALKRDKSTVSFIFLHKSGFISFETGPRIAKKLLEEIKFVKCGKIILGFDDPEIWNGIVMGKHYPRESDLKELKFK